jgi:hypothetical protein
MRPDAAWRRREAVVAGGPVLIERFTSEPGLPPRTAGPLAGREVDLDRREDVPGPVSEEQAGGRVAGVRGELEDLEAERTMNGFEVSLRAGLVRRRVTCAFVARVGDEEIADATVCRTDGGRGGFASERPRRWGAVLGSSDIAPVGFNTEHERAGGKWAREDAMRANTRQWPETRRFPKSDLNLHCITWTRHSCFRVSGSDGV